MTDRADKTDLSGEAGEGEIMAGSVAQFFLIGSHGTIGGLQNGAYILLGAMGQAFAQSDGHDLNETDGKAGVPGQTGQRDQLVIIAPHWQAI